MKFTVEFDTDGRAFAADPRRTVGELLVKVAAQVAHGDDPMDTAVHVCDVNGDRVGFWQWRS